MTEPICIFNSINKQQIYHTFVLVYFTFFFCDLLGNISLCRKKNYIKEQIYNWFMGCCPGQQFSEENPLEFQSHKIKPYPSFSTHNDTSVLESSNHLTETKLAESKQADELRQSPVLADSGQDLWKDDEENESHLLRATHVGNEPIDLDKNCQQGQTEYRLTYPMEKLTQSSQGYSIKQNASLGILSIINQEDSFINDTCKPSVNQTVRSDDSKISNQFRQL